MSAPEIQTLVDGGGGGGENDDEDKPGPGKQRGSHPISMDAEQGGVSSYTVVVLPQHAPSHQGEALEPLANVGTCCCCDTSLLGASIRRLATRIFVDDDGDGPVPVVA